jgi:hypothetical protein
LPPLPRPLPLPLPLRVRVRVRGLPCTSAAANFAGSRFSDSRRLSSSPGQTPVPRYLRSDGDLRRGPAILQLPDGGGRGSSPRLGSRALLQELASATKRPSGERSQGCCCYSCRCCCCCCCCWCCCCRRCRRCCWIGCDLASWTPRPRATRFLACSVSLRRCLSRCPRDASRLMRKKQLMLRRRETTISPLGNPPAVRHPRSHPRALYYVCEKSKLNGSGKLRDWPSNAGCVGAWVWVRAPCKQGCANSNV